MSTINVIEGELSGQEFNLMGPMLRKGFYNVEEYPVSEIIRLTEIDDANGITFFEAEFASGLWLKAKSKKKVFNELKGYFLEVGNKATGITLPITKQSSGAVIMSTIFVAFIVIGLIGSQLDKKKSQNVSTHTKQNWHDCMNHPHWAEFRKAHSYLETASRKVTICGEEP
jgi:hypothetical protein